jgi:alpha-1,6-mannosyltransferase
MPPIGVRAEPPSWPWACLGLGGSVLVALAGPHLAGGPVRWWFDPSLGAAPFYAGIVALSVAWLAIGRLAMTTRELRIVGAAWCVPLLVTAPLFSQDVYSYFAQGTLVHLGIDPYRHAPAVLANVGQRHALGAVDPFWRHTTAPYGPLFLWIVSGVVALAGSHLILGVLLIRVLDLAGLVLLAVFAPRLARALGADPARATWWVLLSPLVLLELVAPAHNDLLMIGLLVAGVALAIERRVLLGIALCALAATIKLPAAAAIVFIAVVWARDASPALARMRRLLASATVAVVVVAAVSLLTGLGLGWISTTVFSTPEEVRLAITPATALGWTAAQLVPVGARGLESALGVVAFGLSIVLGAVLLWRSRLGQPSSDVVRNLGIALIAVAVCGPAAWPWYLIWGLALLAAGPGIQDSRLLALAVAASVLVVKADGILAFPLRTAPVFVVLYVAAAAWLTRRRPAVRTARLRPLAES